MVYILHTASLAVAAVLAYLAAAAPSVPATLRDHKITMRPSDDPFYHVPDGLQDVAPGTILRHRPPPAPIAAFGVAPLRLAATHQILYRTTDSLGNATATVLTVLVPRHADMNKVLSYQVAEDAADINCAPSYVFQLRPAADPDRGTGTTELELLLVEAALEQGWVVIVPDYLGPYAAFLANKLAGHAILDGIRAALHSSRFTGIGRHPKVAMWGYSGGAVASMWAAELQPRYAPELEIAGAAVGGTVPNLITVVTSINGGSHAGFIAAGVMGLTNQYAEAERDVERHLLAQFRDKFISVRSQCMDADTRAFKNQDVIGMFDDRDLVYRVLKNTSLGHGDTPKIPMFVYKSVDDEFSPVAETDALVAAYCGDGASIQYHRDRNSHHGSLAILAAPKALLWLKETMPYYPLRVLREGTPCATYYWLMLVFSQEFVARFTNGQHVGTFELDGPINSGEKDWIKNLVANDEVALA
ncbi:secretory lipase, putative [Cordyceps militaris CM01]|uniref:Secretory lipase, putative n=1 Tax=Cordyceps militaris (strain CM01) TaxID=983644 RepID=G3JFM1_CORMM|nr:secretory lipase, putative [Cordyceps militaris CM01]EGX93595.1 secretory lipase, putative [Cordyceps militaris CM01]